MNSSIIFVNRYFHPDHSATSQLLSDLAFHLAGRGLAVTVVTSTQLYDDPAANLPLEETLMGVDVVRVAGSRFGRSGLAGRAVDYLTFYRGVQRTLARLVDADTLVIAKTDPPLLSIVCGRVTRQRGARLVAWLQDLFPEVATAAGLPLPGPAVALLRRLRDRSLGQAAASVVLSEAMAARVRAAGVAAARVHVIGNWGLATVDPVSAGDGCGLREAWGLDGRFVVGYSGNLGRVHDIDTLLGGIEQSTAMELTWLFVGGGAGMTRLRESLPLRAAGSGQGGVPRLRAPGPAGRGAGRARRAAGEPAAGDGGAGLPEQAGGHPGGRQAGRLRRRPGRRDRHAADR